MPSDDNAPLAVERQRIILSLLNREGVVRNAELKELLSVSLVTIRSDLRELEAAGECEIIWGGAVSKRPSPDREELLDQRSQLNPAQKKRIGQRATDHMLIARSITPFFRGGLRVGLRHWPDDRPGRGIGRRIRHNTGPQQNCHADHCRKTHGHIPFTKALSVR